MDKDRSIGILMFVTCIGGIIIYAWLLLTWAIPVLQITAFVGVAAILAIVAWIGWTMVTTPPPPPIEAPTLREGQSQ